MFREKKISVKKNYVVNVSEKYYGIHTIHLYQSSIKDILSFSHYFQLINLKKLPFVIISLERNYGKVESY